MPVTLNTPHLIGLLLVNIVLESVRIFPRHLFSANKWARFAHTNTIPGPITSTYFVALDLTVSSLLIEAFDTHPCVMFCLWGVQ